MASQDPVEPLLRSIAKAERHVRSEYGTRMVGVMDTVGAYPHFAMMLQPGQVAVLSGRDDIDAMYKASVARAAPQASRFLSQLATDWYVFVDNVPTRLWHEDGEFKTAQTVTMFATDDADGITGEYAWQRHYLPADAPGEVPERALRNLELHEGLLEALCGGDAAGLKAVLAPGCIWAQRDYCSEVAGGAIVNLTDADAIAHHTARWHAALHPVHVSILNRRVTDWYVFAEELWVVAPAGGERRQYRAAVIYAIDATGKVEAVLGFGKAIEALSPSADHKLGIAFWPEGVGPDTTSHRGYPEG